MPKSKLTREAIEAAMDAYDNYLKHGEEANFFRHFDQPSNYWVRSSRERKNRVYPSRPIHHFADRNANNSGGLTESRHSASVLHNSGFIIVDSDDQPVQVPPQDYLLSGAERIRLCALNYFIEPAREKGAKGVKIRAGKLANAMGLKDAFPNICQVLGGKKLQKLAQLPPPKYTEPNPSSSTVFTYMLASQSEPDTMTETPNTTPPSAVNLILYGPPGTGKTYKAAWEAVRLCLGDEAAAPLAKDRDALMAEYKRLSEEGRIEFVTFHQSISYEEFVEGLRPTTDQTDDAAAHAGFRLKPEAGIFKRLCKRAGGGGPDEPNENALSLDGRRVFKMSIGEDSNADEKHLFEEAISEGCALFGREDIDLTDEKFSCINEIKKAHPELNSPESLDDFRNKLKIGDIIVVPKGNKFFRAIGEITGEYTYIPRDDQKYSHRRSVRWLWVDKKGVPADEILNCDFGILAFYPIDESRLKIAALEDYMNSANKAVSHVAQSHVLIIDEINRANISKVFGELITLLEPDKRLGARNEIFVRLPYSKTRFGVPANLHIVGTMNTADRSIALLDTALRRRFRFQELMPDLDTLPENIEGINLRKLLSTLNERIEYLSDREHQIGHAYFIGCRSKADVEEVMRDKVIPLLAEYFYEDWAKVAVVLGDGPDVKKGHFLNCRPLQRPNGMPGDDVNGEKWRWSVKEKFDFSEFEA